MKKRLARFLCGLLTVSMLAGCGTVDEASLLPVTEELVVESSEEPEEYYEMLELTREADTMFATTGNNAVDIPEQTTVNASVAGGTQWGDLIFDNAPYVLIYNPKIYSGDNSGAMASGDYSNLILHSLQRADGLEETEETVNRKKADDQPGQISADEVLTPYILEDVEFDGQRADVLEPIYAKGDTHDFFYGIGENRAKGTFKCVYSGEYCYIWSIDNSISEKKAKAQGKEFDQKIYPQTLEYYGQPRFTENGGKVNILYYSMEQFNYGGFFTWADIYSSNEISASRAEKGMYNTDHAIINICSHCDKTYNLNTLAHELQHLVVASDWALYKKTPVMASWLNEAMSANAEERYEDGVKDSHGSSQSYFNSTAYRNGQSLYNFTTDYASDTGTYGVVYLFQEYLQELAGDTIFSKIHKFWRTSMSKKITEAESLVKSIPEDAKTTLDEKYYYDEELISLFQSDYEAWMSKMTLDFYLQSITGKYSRIDIYSKNYTINSKKASAEQWTKLFRKERLYLGNGAISIEGGGCLLVATQDGNFYQPANADLNLIYVALDENFQPIATNLKDANTFYWNKSKSVTVIADSWTVENNAQQVMYQGIVEGLSESGFYCNNTIAANTSDQKLGELRNILKQTTNRPGIIIMTYDPAPGKEEDYKKVLTEAHRKGILVITVGPHSIAEEDMTWGVHFDHTNLIESVSDFYTYKAGTNIASLGAALASFGMDIINHEQDHWSLYYQK